MLLRYRRRMNSPQPIGHLLREWRQRRRLSQLDFATEAEISAKHLSFLETGRSQPSREMLLKLSEILEVPLRERNTMLVAAGFAPMFTERSLDDPALEAAREEPGVEDQQESERQSQRRREAPVPAHPVPGRIIGVRAE